MAYPSTFLSLQTRVIAKARLDATADLQFVKDSINITYAQLVIESGYLVASANYTLTAGTGTYDLSSLAAAVQRIKYAYITSGGVVSEPLQHVSLEQIITYRKTSGSSAVAGGPTLYSLTGYKQLDVWPTPASADTLTIYHVLLPTALSGDTDVSILPEPYGSRAIEYGALVEAADFKGDPGLTRYEAKFAEWQGRLNTHIARRGGAGPGQFSWAPSSQRVPHDNAMILPA